jgi:hypothetical protein
MRFEAATVDGRQLDRRPQQRRFTSRADRLVGPSPDFDYWIKPMEQARSRVRMTTLLADAGYDAEWIHVAARYAFQTRTLIPPKHGRPTKKPPRQYYRRRMARIFAKKRKRRPYGQRSQVETVFSVVKRRLDSSVNAHNYWSQCRALMLKALTHNIMLLRRKQVFDTAVLTRMALPESASCCRGLV